MVKRKQAEDTPDIGKRNGGDLWLEIRRMYESNTQPSYEKIKELLMLEFNLDKFPSKRTFERRIKSENWVRNQQDSANASQGYSDEFWHVVKTVYESDSSLTHKRLAELVQNELQIDHFPSRQAVAAKAKRDGWQSADKLIKRGDAALQRLKKNVKNSTKITIKVDGEDCGDFDIFEGHSSRFYDLDDDAKERLQDVQKALKTKIKNVLMEHQGKTIKIVEAIQNARKRMRSINEIGDMLSDRMMELYVLRSSPELQAMLPDEFRLALTQEEIALGSHLARYSELSYSRRESIKFELSLYGVNVEDLRDNDNAGRMKDLTDETAMNAQRERLIQQRKELMERRHYIESGGLEADAQKIQAERMAEMNEDYADCEEADFSEVD